jgi:small-conductance mechanosensitive channel
MNIPAVFGQTIEWLSTSGLRILVVLVVTLLALKTVALFSDYVFSVRKHEHLEWDEKKRVKTLSWLLRYILSIIVVVAAICLIIREVGIQLGPLLAAAGIAGLAIGFGAQHLVQDLTSGFFIMIDDEIRVGDIVEAAGKRGTVERVTLRRTVLRDIAGNVHYIPNGKIDLVTNMTKEFSRYHFEIAVAYREDIDEVFAVIREVGKNMQQDREFADMILEPVEILGLDRFADSAMVIKGRIKTRPIKQWKVGREFNRRLKIAFDSRGIEIPYPHVTVYFGQNRQGHAAPARVTILDEERKAITTDPDAVSAH